MNRQLKKVPETFDPKHPEPDQAADEGTDAVDRGNARDEADGSPRPRGPAMSPADPASTNTLGLATSPYLRQHADNPVHWQQWTPQALAAAAARDVPILLSVGYAACHWCHVMAHESFEDDEVAAAMNADSSASRSTVRNAPTSTPCT